MEAANLMQCPYKLLERLTARQMMFVLIRESEERERILYERRVLHDDVSGPNLVLGGDTRATVHSPFPCLHSHITQLIILYTVRYLRCLYYLMKIMSRPFLTTSIVHASREYIPQRDYIVFGK